jgi:tetratricopeptide (TPR) repeat protein
MTEATRPRPDVYTAGGTLTLEVPTYVERVADSELFEELRRRHYCYVLTPRQMGKSSLIVRTRKRLEEVSVASVAIDITGIGKNVTEEQWYTGHADEIALSLDLPPTAMKWWSERSDLGPVQRFSRYLSDCVLETLKSDVVIFVDEIDSTIGLPFSDDYFAAIRALFNRRPNDARLSRLTFVLLGVASPADLIKDPQRTPFNIGTPIKLTDFTREEARPLLQGLAPEPDLAEKLLDRVLFWTGGHPYLSQRACRVVAEWAQTNWDALRVPSIVDEKVRETFLADDKRESDFNLQTVSDRVKGRVSGIGDGEAPKRLHVYRDIVRGARVADEDLDPVKMTLKLSGLVVADPSGLRVRNKIYQTVFDETWIRSMLGEPEPQSKEEFQYDVFISYSNLDHEFVAGFLSPRLKEASLRVASDLELLPGQNWTEELPRMRQASKFFLPVISPDWTTSRGAQEEFALMSNRVGKIVPVLLRPTRLPPFLESIQWADFTEPSTWEIRLKDLISVLGGQPMMQVSRDSQQQVKPAAADDRRRESFEIMTKRFDRDKLVKFISERYPAVMPAISVDLSQKAIADLLWSRASRAGRIEELTGALAEGSRSPEPVEPVSTAAGSTHAFVAMPFGRKQDIAFDRIYQELVRPALESVGFEVFRSDEDLRAGSIRADIFQELLLADLVVADLSIDNPNVWYELGVRHALRARGVIQIQGGRDSMPFDVYTDRTVRYHLKDGEPDPAYLDSDRRALAAMAEETMRTWQGRKVSPVYHLLPHLKEPGWKDLQVTEATESRTAQKDWERRIEVARRLGRPGDIMVLADEAPARALRMEAYRAAARALQSRGKYKLALEQCERALDLDPVNRENRSLKGLLLSRLKRFDDAREWLRAVLIDYQGDAESWGLLGRVEKEAWKAAWRKDVSTPQTRRDEAVFEDALLRQSIKAYTTGFLEDPSNPYTGINAATLLRLLSDLTGEPVDAARLLAIEGGVRWAATSKLEKDPDDYWSRVTLADLQILSGDRQSVERAYRNAVSAAQNDWFALDSSRQQLLLLEELAFRPEVVEAALRIFNRALERLQSPAQSTEPSQVILFAGHMIDRPDRPKPRFPPDKVSVAAAAIERVLDAQLNAFSTDLALCSGASGGDLLFAEACLRRGLKLELRIPLEEQRFLRESVTFAGDEWRERFYAVKAHANTKLYVMPDELGPTAAKTSPYARVNLWQLYSAIARGDERLRFVCLWDGKGGDGPGGTKHMFDVARSRAGQVYHLDTTRLFGLETA